MWFDGANPPILFEALPTEAKASQAQQEFHLDMFRPLRTFGACAINVPEIIGGHYETVEPRKFASHLQKVTGLPAMVNRITVHQSTSEFTCWLDETTGNHEVNHFVMVGGETSKTTYSGLNVPAALSHARQHLPKKSTLGCITIPTRRRSGLDEPERLIAKQKAGADHAISQILGESESAAALQRDLAIASAKQDVSPLPIFWSLAPVARKKDIQFMQWLGVEFPKPYEQKLREAGSRPARIALSHDINESMARNLLEHAEAEEHGPIGFCIEHVMQSNMAPAFELVERIHDVVAEFRSAIPAVTTP